MATVYKEQTMITINVPNDVIDTLDKMIARERTRIIDAGERGISPLPTRTSFVRNLVIHTVRSTKK